MKNRSKNDNDSQSTDTQIAKLAYIGSVITTIGDGIAAYAAGLALSELENGDSQDGVDQTEVMGQLVKMQKQLDMLSLRLDKLERTIGKV